MTVKFTQKSLVKYHVKSLFKVPVYNVNGVSVIYILVHFSKELQKTGEIGLLAKTMLVFP